VSGVQAEVVMMGTRGLVMAPAKGRPVASAPTLHRRPVRVIFVGRDRGRGPVYVRSTHERYHKFSVPMPGDPPAA
jgi:hypothetical protein